MNKVKEAKINIKHQNIDKNLELSDRKISGYTNKFIKSTHLFEKALSKPTKKKYADNIENYNNLVGQWKTIKRHKKQLCPNKYNTAKWSYKRTKYLLKHACKMINIVKTDENRKKAMLLYLLTRG